MAKHGHFPDVLEYGKDIMEEAFLYENPVKDFIDRNTVNKRIQSLLSKTLYRVGGHTYF